MGDDIDRCAGTTLKGDPCKATTSFGAQLRVCKAHDPDELRKELLDLRAQIEALRSERDKIIDRKRCAEMESGRQVADYRAEANAAQEEGRTWIKRAGESKQAVVDAERRLKELDLLALAAQALTPESASADDVARAEALVNLARELRLSSRAESSVGTEAWRRKDATSRKTTDEQLY